MQACTALVASAVTHYLASAVTVISALSDSAPSKRYRDVAGDDDRIAFARILRAGPARPRAIQRPNSTTALVIRRPTIAPIVGTRSALVRLEIAEMDTARTHSTLAGHFNCSPQPAGRITHGIDLARRIYKAISQDNR